MSVLLPARLAELDRAVAWFEVRRLENKTVVVAFPPDPATGGYRVVRGEAPRSHDPAADVWLAAGRVLADLRDREGAA